MTLQMSIDGREVPLEVLRARYAGEHRRRRLTANQATIMRMLGAEGVVRTVDAGVIVHASRGYCGHGGARWSRWTGKGRACCPYAYADGLSCLKRMAARGLIYRDPNTPGRWLAP